MTLIRTTQPATEPITLAEAKIQLRVDSDYEDTLITSMIKAARIDCEQRLQRTLITSGWTWKIDSFYGLSRLPMPNLLSVTSITYLDVDGASQVLNPDTYRVSGIGGRGCIVPVDTWPETADQLESVTIVYTAGYGASVPETLKFWMLLAIGDMYSNRERSSDRPVVPQNFADSLLDPEKVWG